MIDSILILYAKPLIYVFGGLFLFFIYLFIAARLHWVLRFIGVPLLLAAALFTYSSLDRLLGFPYPGTIPENSHFLGYHLQPMASDMYFTIWAYAGHDGKSRLYLVPYTQAQDEELRTYREKLEQGQVGIRPKTESKTHLKKSTDQVIENESEYELYVMPEIIPEQKGPSTPR